jgi:NTE family protein
MRVGLCLSGGGSRAMVFHLGVFARLASQGVLEKVAFVSTVSGGSLVVGLTLSLSNYRWPSSDTYCSKILPRVRSLLTTHNLQGVYVRRCLSRPWRLLRGRASVLASAIEDTWPIDASLQDLPSTPRWLLNATTYETGKNWRFERKRMGDWVMGYVLEPDFPLAQAMAASAAFPGLIGPLVVRSDEYSWHRYDHDAQGWTSSKPSLPHVCLWDGGVYENLGLEPLFKPGRGYREGVDFLLVSDASGASSSNPPRYRAPHRLIEIATEQVRGLRARMIVSHFEVHPGTGAYFRLGNTAREILRKARVAPPHNWNPANALSPEDVAWAKTCPTNLKRLSAAGFERLFHHGFEVADITLAAYCPKEFDHVPYTRGPAVAPSPTTARSAALAVSH